MPIILGLPEEFRRSLITWGSSMWPKLLLSMSMRRESTIGPVCSMYDGSATQTRRTSPNVERALQQLSHHSTDQGGSQMADKTRRLIGLALVLTCTLVAACTSNEPGRGSRVIQELDVQLREILLLGGDESASHEYLFGSPRYIVTDAQGRIYVADQEFMNIRVYDDSGRYIRTLGERGQGSYGISELPWTCNQPRAGTHCS